MQTTVACFSVQNLAAVSDWQAEGAVWKLYYIIIYIYLKYTYYIYIYYIHYIYIYYNIYIYIIIYITLYIYIISCVI